MRIRRGVSTARTDWWFQFFNEFTPLINPGLYAFEGNELRPPSFDEFRDSFDEGSKEIASQLPGAKLVSYGEIHYKAAYDMLLEFSDRYDHEAKFLMKVAPKVTFRPANSHLSQTEAEILEIAAELGLKTHSLAVIAILACLYERADGTGFLAARRIIKPSTSYGPQNAHNALADLRALEIFISGVGLGREPFALCTCDKAIVAFWCGLDAHAQHWNDERLSFTVSVTEHLFPRLQPVGREQLAAIIGGESS